MFGGEPVASFYVQLELHQEFGTRGVAAAFGNLSASN